MKDLHIGVIGFGFMGRAHTLGYQTIPLFYQDLPFRIHLRAVCAAHPERAEAARDRHGFSYAAGDLHTVLEDPEIDCVSICLPTGLHAEAAEAALRAGKHVYCDKPLAADCGEARRLAQLAEEAGVTAQVAFQQRCSTGVMRARQLLEEGRLGRILSFRACYLHSGGVDASRPAGWRFDPAGGGVLFDLGSHVLDLISWLLGRFSAVSAACRTLYPQRPGPDGTPVEITTDDAVWVLARMQDGAVGTIEASKLATGTTDELRLEIHGDRGALRYNSLEPGRLYYYDAAAPVDPIGGLQGFTAIECGGHYPAPGGGFPGGKFGTSFLRGHIHSLYTFLDNAAAGRPGTPSFADGAYIQSVMERILRSHQTGQWETL